MHITVLDVCIIESLCKSLRSKGLRPNQRAFSFGFEVPVTYDKLQKKLVVQDVYLSQSPC